MSSNSKPKFKIIVKEQKEKQELEEGFMDYVDVIGGDIKKSVQNYFKSVGDRANTRSNRRAANTLIRGLQSQLAPLREKCARNPSQCDQRTKRIIKRLEGLIRNLQENPGDALEAIADVGSGQPEPNARRAQATERPITGTTAAPAAAPTATAAAPTATAAAPTTPAAAQKAAPAAAQKAAPAAAQKARQLRKNPKPGKVLSRASALYRLQAAGVDDPKQKATQISTTIIDFLKGNPSIKEKIKVLAEDVNLAVGKDSLLATLRKDHPGVDTRILQIIVSDIAAQLKASQVTLISTRKQLKKSKKQQKSDSGEEPDQEDNKKVEEIFNNWALEDFEGDYVSGWIIRNTKRGLKGSILSQLGGRLETVLGDSNDWSELIEGEGLDSFIGFLKMSLKKNARKKVKDLRKLLIKTIEEAEKEDSASATLAEGRTLQESFNKRNQKIYNSLLKKFLKN